MLYRFKSKATGDVVMLQGSGDEVLTLLGREPASQGIFEVADAPAVMATLKAAVAEQERRIAAGELALKPGEVSLRQRAWPLVEMLTRAHAAGEPVVWGV